MRWVPPWPTMTTLIDALLLSAIAVATALATGIGALPVALLGVRAAAIKPLLSGLASGVMVVAAVQGLLVPALDEGRAVVVVAAAIAGAVALLASRRCCSDVPPSPASSLPSRDSDRRWCSACCSRTACPRAWRSAARTPRRAAA